MAEEIQKKLIEEEMKESYMDYAMSVIVSRALPDARDGLKPVHRRILYTMYEDGMRSDRPFRKSAATVGSVLGKRHPHGDMAVYDALVRMVQPFSLRYPLIDGHGNFGSIEGFSAAAQRYTEARISKFAEELLQDIEKNTVDFIPNFDGTNKEPVVLPSKIPNLLVNGSSGIAVGMATNFPPHNLREVIDGVIHLIENKEATIDELINFVKGPDFPTAGIIVGKNGILSAYKLGRGHIKLRAKVEIKENKIIIVEIPYQVNKNTLIENIAQLVREKKVQGISDIIDESDRKGMSIVIEIKKSYNPDVIINQLYKHTQLEVTFGAILIALDKNQPVVLNLKQAMQIFIDHRVIVVRRKAEFDLEKAKSRLHILEGLEIALTNIDAVIKLIKSSKDAVVARKALMDKYKLTEIQSNAILDMRLQRLTSLEQDKIKNETKELKKLIVQLEALLGSDENILKVIKKELTEIRDKYGDDRRTEILDIEEEVEIEDLIQENDIVVTTTYSGYIKQTPLALYRSQGRGGFGVKGAKVGEEDLIEHLFITSNHNFLLFFTSKGKVHWMKAYKTPSGGRTARGKAIVNLLNLAKDEKLNTILPISEFVDNSYLLFATKDGLLKKTSLKEYSKPRQGGIRAISLRPGDEVVQVRLTTGNSKMILATKNGQAVKFNEQDVRAMGRTATGVRGVKLRKDEVIGMEPVLDNSKLLTITENGFGKRTDFEDYRLIKRGGSGVKNIKVNTRNGSVVGVKTVNNNDEVMLISKNGIVIRIPVKNISIIGRNTQGVTMMKLRAGDKVITIAKVIQNHD